MSMIKDGAKYEVCFVRKSEEENASSEDKLELAFEAMTSNQLEPVWVTEEEVLKISKKELKLFVMDPFEGAAFKHLKSVQCRIIGPLCILYCLQYEDMLPKRPYPVYSVSMRRITVSCSNIDNNQREDISHRVILMGGLFSKDLTKSVSHLVVGEVGSKKYQVAANFGLPIMTPDWIEDVWRNGQYQQIHASDACYNKFKCPVFKGLVVTVSQLSAEERTAVQNLVIENGGTYLAPLKAHKTTHLVLTEPTGDKYRYAKTWKVFCVNVNWIYESIKTGYCKDENLYKIDDTTTRTQPKRSTPNKDLTSIDLPHMDCSVIPNASVITQLDETIKSDFSFQVNNRKTSLKSSLESFDLSTLPKYGQFLDGCKIYLTGFNSTHLDKLRRIVNSGGAIRFSKYTESISHVVCGDLSSEFRQVLKASSVKPYVVNHDWLLECCKTETLVDEKPFLCMDDTLLSPEKNEPEVQITFSQPPKVQPRIQDETPDNIASIFNQYVTGQNLNEGNSSKKLETGRASLEQKESEAESRNAARVVENGNENHQEEVTADMDESPGSEQLFAGLKFVIFCFGEKDSDILSRMVESHAGTVFNTDDSSKADIAVVPIIWQEYKAQVPNIITNCWLQKCIEDSRIYDFDENELFRPVQVVPGKMPFESFVISVSQYTGTERDCLMHLAEVLGATCQEYFVRKANKSRGILSNTHLIVATPEGSKYEAAKKWKIPALNKQWVLDAAKFGFPPPIEDYCVDAVASLPVGACNPITDTNVNQRENLNIDLVPAVSSKCPQNVTPRRSGSRMRIEGKTEEKLVTPTIQDRSSRKSDGASHKDQDKLEIEFRTPNALVRTSRGDRSLLVENEPEVKEVTPCPKISTPQPHAVKRQNGSEGGTSVAEPNFVTPHRNVASIRNESKLHRTISPVIPKGEASLNDTSDTLNLDQSYKFKFQVSGLLNDLENSASHERSLSSKGTRHSLLVEELFSRNLASALRFVNDKMQLQNESGLDCEKNSFNETYHQPQETSGVLKGVVLFVAKKLNHLQNELSETVCSLGGEFLWSYDNTCTHFVFIGKANDLTKEFREARNQGKKVVCPQWVYACKEKNAHLDEGLYPHTLKANMTLADEISIVKTSSQNIISGKDVASTSAKSDQPVEDKTPAIAELPVIDETPVIADLPVMDKAPAVTDLQVSGVTSAEGNVADFNQQLNDLLVAAKSAKRRQSKRLLDSVSSSPNNDVSPIHQLQQKRLSSSFVKSARAEESGTGEEQDLGSQQSQSCPVVWDDPTGRQEREKIAAALTAANDAQSTSHKKLSFNCADMHTLDFEISSAKNSLVINSPIDETSAKNCKEACPPPKIKKFMFTTIPDSKKVEYIEIIDNLGGEVSDEKSFDITASHLIMPKPMKNEKFLSSVASGKWVLHPQYLLACREQNKFLPEEDFEWGGPCTIEFISNLSSNSNFSNSIKKIAHCPFQWRDKLSRSKDLSGAFHDWFVVIVADDEAKQSTYRKILEAGGGVVVPSETAGSVLEKITHTIVDMKKRSLSQVDLNVYVSQNIKCVKPEYIAFYLIEDPPPDIETFIIPEVKEMMNLSDSSSKRRNLSRATRVSKRTRLT